MPSMRSMKLYAAKAPIAMKAAAPERELAAVAGQDVEPERGERQDQERDQDGREHVLVGQQRHGETAKAISPATPTGPAGSVKICWSAA
jgi:hypothetical protein